MMNLIQKVIQLFKITDASPNNDRQALYDLEQAGQKIVENYDESPEADGQHGNQNK